MNVSGNEKMSYSNFIRTFVHMSVVGACTCMCACWRAFMCVCTTSV